MRFRHFLIIDKHRELLHELQAFLSLFFILIMCSSKLFAQPKEDFWNKFHQSKDNNEKLKILHNIIEKRTANLQSSDSLYNIAIYIADLNGLSNKKLGIYHSYANNKLSNISEIHIKDYVQQAQNLNNKEALCESNIRAYNYYIEHNSNNIAKKHLEAAQFYGKELTNKEIEIRLLQISGLQLQIENKNLEAYRYFSNALLKSKLLEKVSCISESRTYLFKFFKHIHNAEKLEHFASEEMQFQSQQKPIDSIAYMNAISLMSLAKFENNESEKGVELSYLVIDFENRKKINFLKESQLQTLRIYALNHNDFKELHHLYFIKYPEEFESLAKTDTIIYLRVKACIYELQNKLDSATILLQLAENKILNAHKSSAYVANFYKRFAEYYLRILNKNAAITNFMKSYTYAKDANYLPWLVESADQLQVLYASQNNMQQAYFYLSESKKYQDSINNNELNDQQLKIEINNENAYQLATQEKQAEKNKKNKNLQYMAVVILLSLCFVSLAIISSLKYSKLLIRALAFISFIFLFEFIILLADEKIHHITHGEPLKIMGIKIILISILLPLHHKVEHNVIHYLYEHKIIEPQRIKAILINIKNAIINIFKPEI
jgi:hypothetical protein